MFFFRSEKTALVKYPFVAVFIVIVPDTKYVVIAVNIPDKGTMLHNVFDDFHDRPARLRLDPVSRFKSTDVHG